MTISTTTIKNSYSGDGSVVAFTYTFKIADAAFIEVIVKTNSTGAESVRAIGTGGTNYAVTGVNEAAGGTVTFVTAPLATETVVLRRSTTQTQTLDLIENDNLPANSLETAFDKNLSISQELQEQLDRSIKISRANTMTSTEFTVGATDRANKILAFDSAGELSVTQELGTFKGSDTTTTTAAYVVRDMIKSTTAGQLNNVYICTAASVIGDTLTDTDHFALLVDAYSAAASEVAAAASAVDAQSSEDDAAADLVLTNADVVLTNADVVSTNADVVSTNADVVLTNADAAATAADLVATNQDTIDTAADLVATNQDTIDTAADLVATNQDTLDTAADLVLTNADVVLTHADVVSTNADVVLTAADAAATALDKIATNADVVLTGADVISSAASASAAASSYDSFDDRYLGAKSSAPSVDNDSNTLVTGALYFNSSAGNLNVWSGSAWVAIQADTDVKVSVSSNDTTPNYLLSKFTAGTNISLTETNDGGNETITITNTGEDPTALAIALG
jgi:hypothetical protein